MLDILAFIDTLWPPKDDRDRRWWRLGIVLGGTVFAVGAITVFIGSF